jgi:hypothetical protein
VICAATGWCYGVYLAFLGFLATGFGHGVYVPCGLFSAPLSLFDNIPLAMLSPPVLWCLTGALLGGARRRICLAGLLLVMAAHYASLPFVLRSPSVFADWDYVFNWGYIHHLREVLWVGLVVYATGQAAIWVTLVFLLMTDARK